MIRLELAEGDIAKLPELVELWRESWHKGTPDTDFSARVPWFSDFLPKLIASGARLRVATDDIGALLGFVTIDPVSGYLDTLVVAVSHWGEGVAQALLDDACAVCPAGVDLKVNQRNLRAIALYEKYGFTRGRADVNETSGASIWHYHWRP